MFRLHTFLVLLYLGVHTGAFCPQIIPRDSWDAENLAGKPMKPQPATHVIIHHSNTPTCLLREDCSALVKSIQKRHKLVNQWPDIGYNFLIGGDGNIYEGTGWYTSAGSIPGYDSRSLSVCVMGEYTSSLPNEKAMRALKKFIDCAAFRGELQKDYKVVGHRQLAEKDCPGNKLYQEIRSWDRWNPY